MIRPQHSAAQSISRQRSKHSKCTASVRWLSVKAAVTRSGHVRSRVRGVRPIGLCVWGARSSLGREVWPLCVCVSGGQACGGGGVFHDNHNEDDTYMTPWGAYLVQDFVHNGHVTKSNQCDPAVNKEKLQQRSANICVKKYHCCTRFAPYVPYRCFFWCFPDDRRLTSAMSPNWLKYLLTSSFVVCKKLLFCAFESFRNKWTAKINNDHRNCSNQTISAGCPYRPLLFLGLAFILTGNTTCCLCLHKEIVLTYVGSESFHFQSVKIKFVCHVAVHMVFKILQHVKKTA